MKAMILVLSSKECMNLLNGDLSVLVRRKFPKNYSGLVYAYCAEDRYSELCYFEDFGYRNTMVNHTHKLPSLNGKVAARFWCDKVEKIIDRETKEKNYYSFGTESLQTDELEKMSCLDIQELCKYIGEGARCLYGDYGRAIHIKPNSLDIFDKPKELWRFKTPKMAERYKYDLKKAREDHCEIGERIAEGVANDDECANCVELTEMSEYYYGLQRAPSNYCYVEAE